MENNENVNLMDISTEQKAILLAWAKKVKDIQKNGDLKFKQKIKKLKTLNNSEAFKSCNKIVAAYSKRYWKNANWAERMGIIGGGGAIALFGFGGAGIAAFGGAIGLPLFLVTAAGGTLIGTIIDKLEK